MNQPSESGSGQVSLSWPFAIQMLRARCTMARRAVEVDEVRYAVAVEQTKVAYSDYLSAPLVSCADSDPLRGVWYAAKIREQVYLESLAACRGRELDAARELLAMVLH